MLTAGDMVNERTELQLVELERLEEKLSFRRGFRAVSSHGGGQPVEMAGRQVYLWPGVMGGGWSQRYPFRHHWVKSEFQAL